MSSNDASTSQSSGGMADTNAATDNGFEQGQPKMFDSDGPIGQAFTGKDLFDL
jgi:hypothetical protein